MPTAQTRAATAESLYRHCYNVQTLYRHGTAPTWHLGAPTMHRHGTDTAQLQHGILELQHGILELQHGLLELQHALLELQHALLELQHGLSKPPNPSEKRGPFSIVKNRSATTRLPDRARVGTLFYFEVQKTTPLSRFWRPGRPLRHP